VAPEYEYDFAFSEAEVRTMLQALNTQKGLLSGDISRMQDAGDKAAEAEAEAELKRIDEIASCLQEGLDS
jgi:hypothetical protein